jgi:hypothetical protein
MQGLPVTVGAGLQTNFNPFCCPLTVQLSGPAPAGGLTVHIESNSPAVALVSADGLTEGTSAIDIDIDEGDTQAFYYVHGLEGASGAATITATAPGFGETGGTVTVVQPALQIVNLPANTTPLSANSEFQVAVGLADATNTFLFTVMPVRAGRTLTTTVTTSNTDVGLLVTEADGAGQNRQVTIEENTYFTAGTVDTGGIAFDPVGGGATTVTATIPGFTTTTAGTVAVSVGTPGITMQGLPLTVGAGLQTNVNPFCCALAVVLGASEHGLIDVTITSSNPSVALVSANANDLGAASIQIEVPNGETIVPYYIHGVEGATGTVTITATAAGFSDGSGTATVAQAALQIVNLPANTTTTSGDTEFEVFVGLPDATNSFLATTMPVRVGSSLMATVTSSNADVGALVKQGGPVASSQQVSIAAGSYFTPFGVASGGVAFRPVGPGTTLVSAAIPGVLTTTAGAVTVQVTSGGGGGGLRGTKKKK